MSEETPKFEPPVAAPAPAPTPGVKQVSKVSKEGGKAPDKPATPILVNGQVTYQAPSQVEEDKSPKFKMLVNCGEFAVGQVVSLSDIVKAHPNADDWIKRGIIAKEPAPV